MIKLTNISKKYNHKEILDQISVNIDAENTIYAILGQSGVGKTTLFNILFGLDFDYEGSYIFNGINTKELSMNEWNAIRRYQMHIVFQDFKLLEHCTVGENIYIADNSCTRDEIIHVLDLVQMSSFIDKKVSQCSGGEKQRVAIARSLINSPKIILFDEPTGNLDDANTNNFLCILKELRKLGVTLLLITHDSRVLSTCDIVYEIKDKKIKTLKDNLISNSTLDNDMNIVTTNVKDKILNITKISMNRNKFDLFLNNLPIIALFTIFITILGFLWVNSVSNINKFYEGLSKDAIYINVSNYTDKYRNESQEKNVPLMTDGKRIYFSLNDIEEVKKIKGIKDVTVYNGSTTSFLDTEFNELKMKIEKKELSRELKSMSSYVFYPEIVQFKFKTLNIPSEFIDSYNSNQIILIKGRFPKDFSNELLIPDFLAIHWGEDFLDKKINLDVMDRLNKSIKKKYRVVGIYKSNYEVNLDSVQTIYIGHRSEDLTELVQSNETYNFFKNNYVNSGGNLKGSLFESKDIFIQAMGTGYGDMIIKLQDINDLERVTKEIEKLFPNQKFLSHALYNKGEYRSMTITMYKILFCLALILAIVFAIIIIFLNKSYIKRRNKEFAILFSLGYSRGSCSRLLFSEFLFVTVINYVLAYFVLFVMVQVYFKYSSFSEIFMAVFTFDIFSIGLIYVLFMTCISIVISMRGIKSKNLIKHLR